MSEPLTKQSLIHSFRNLGIERGAYVVVHSSLRSLGPIEDGADAVIDALLSCIGQEGLLMVPTFTYNTDRFDPDTTPSRAGKLTEVLRKRQNAVRSLHPTHSVAAIGDKAADICEGHHLLPGIGVDSPLDRMAQAAGGILLLGVGHATNSTVHAGEAHSGLPYKDIPFDPRWAIRASIIGAKIGNGADEIQVDLLDSPGCSRAFGVIEAPLRRKGVIRDGIIGKGLAQWMPGQEVVASTVDLLKQDVAALLCNDLDCYRCSKARERIGEFRRFSIE